MDDDIADNVNRLIGLNRFEEAYSLLKGILAEEPSDWNVWYLAGQCCRFSNDIDGAIYHHARALEINDRERSIYLAIGIAYQLDEQFEIAIKMFGNAIKLDQNYAMAYNSLALTQKKKGELDKAAHNYEAGALALARAIIFSMRNDPKNIIYKHKDTVGGLWLGYATQAAMVLCASDDRIKGLSWPTGEMAFEEERTERHSGLYWADYNACDNEGISRLFLPNYFNTFRQTLRRDNLYANLIGNRGTVLEMLGRHEEAESHFDEANEFMPTGAG